MNTKVVSTDVTPSENKSDTERYHRSKISSDIWSLIGIYMCVATLTYVGIQQFLGVYTRDFEPLIAAVLSSIVTFLSTITTFFYPSYYRAKLLEEGNL